MKPVHEHILVIQSQPVSHYLEYCLLSCPDRDAKIQLMFFAALKVSSIESVIAFNENVYEAHFARFGGNSTTHPRTLWNLEITVKRDHHHIIVLTR